VDYITYSSLKNAYRAFFERNNNMEHAEYKKILDKAMADYVNSGGSVFYMASVVKEYIFDYDNENMAYEARRSLEDKAIKAITEKKNLPDGIQLKQCIWHGKGR